MGAVDEHVELESRVWEPACEMWEPVCRVLELE